MMTYELDDIEKQVLLGKVIERARADLNDGRPLMEMRRPVYASGLGEPPADLGMDEFPDLPHTTTRHYSVGKTVRRRCIDETGSEHDEWLCDVRDRDTADTVAATLNTSERRTLSEEQQELQRDAESLCYTAIRLSGLHYELNNQEWDGLAEKLAKQVLGLINGAIDGEFTRIEDKAST